MDYTEGFIITTANDYCMSKDTVRGIADKSKDSNEFYEKLEEFIAARRHQA